MKKRVLSSLALGLLFSVTMVAQENLLVNPGFELPGGDGPKFEKDGFNGVVPGWILNQTDGDSGLEKRDAIGSDGSDWVAYACDYDSYMYQPTGITIDDSYSTLTLSYSATVTWSSREAGTEFKFETYLYAYSAEDASDRVLVTTFSDVNVDYWDVNDYTTYTHKLETIPAELRGKKLAIAFDLIDEAPDAAVGSWAWFDAFSLTAEKQVVAQENLLINPGFELPGGDGPKFEKDGFNGVVPGWMLDQTDGDSGLEKRDAIGSDGSDWVAYACDYDSYMYQPTGITIDDSYLSLTISYSATVTWSSREAGTEFKFETYLYAYTAEDASDRVLVTTFSDVNVDYWDVNDYTTYTHKLETIPAELRGKKLAVAFDLIDEAPDAAAGSWAWFDAFSLNAEKNATAIKNKNVEQINVYPNPSNGIINLNKIGQNDLVKVYDVTGSLIFSATNTKQIDLSSKSKGVYILSVTAADKSVRTQRLIIE